MLATCTVEIGGVDAKGMDPHAAEAAINLGALTISPQPLEAVCPACDRNVLLDLDETVTCRCCGFILENAQ